MNIIKGESNFIHKTNKYRFEIGDSFTKYIIKLNKEENNRNIFISIIKENMNENITYESHLNFDIFNDSDKEFFSCFNENISLLFKFLIRLFLAKLITIKESIYDCLILKLEWIKDNKIKNINITIPRINNIHTPIDYKNKEIIQNNNNNFFYDIKKKNKDEENEKYEAPTPFKDSRNRKYSIKILKKVYPLNNTDTYKEIVIKIIELEDKINISKFYAYLSIVDFMSLSKPYCELFNYSIDDIYDDLIIILSNKNIEIEKKDKYNIKLFYQIFNVKKITNKEPYFFISILLNRIKRTQKDLESKIQKYKNLKSNNFNKEEDENICNEFELYDKSNDIIDIREKSNDYKNTENKSKKIHFSQNYNDNLVNNEYFYNLLNSNYNVEKNNDKNNHYNNNENKNDNFRFINEKKDSKLFNNNLLAKKKKLIKIQVYFHILK